MSSCTGDQQPTDTVMEQVLLERSGVEQPTDTAMEQVLLELQKIVYGVPAHPRIRGIECMHFYRVPAHPRYRMYAFLQCSCASAV